MDLIYKVKLLLYFWSILKSFNVFHYTHMKIKKSNLNFLENNCINLNNWLLKKKIQYFYSTGKVSSVLLPLAKSICILHLYITLIMVLIIIFELYVLVFSLL